MSYGANTQSIYTGTKQKTSWINHKHIIPTKSKHIRIASPAKSKHICRANSEHINNANSISPVKTVNISALQTVNTFAPKAVNNFFRKRHLYTGKSQCSANSSVPLRLADEKSRIY
jgi:hypothetical protein